MHLGIEGSCLGCRAQRRDRFCVSSLPRERHPEVERRIGILGARIEDESKCALSLCELLVLQRLPSMCKSEVRRWRMRIGARVRADSSLARP
jgi:hypothetical protein